MRYLPALVLLAGCAQLPVDNLPVLRAALSKPPPAGLVAPCIPPVALESRAYNSKEVAKLWLTDRISLATCVRLDAGVVQYYAGRDADLLKLTGGAVTTPAAISRSVGMAERIMGQ